jgi:hypothetical protein
MTKLNEIRARLEAVTEGLNMDEHTLFHANATVDIASLLSENEKAQAEITRLESQLAAATEKERLRCAALARAHVQILKNEFESIARECEIDEDEFDTNSLDEFLAAILSPTNTQGKTE